ncbi:hypothetical protein CFP56_037621 [Quercus suber]|uniref:Uncharacterized protein n=1 Tax=Quercus suber TaxID=58331 RepID=A0AAW0J4E1_QUESU
MNKELKKDLVDLLSEELNLQKDVANETIAHTKVLILDATKTLSHYQKEAEKCNVGMETCEEGREKAERELIEERKLSALWEKRAQIFIPEFIKPMKSRKEYNVNFQKLKAICIKSKTECSSKNFWLALYR